MKLNDKITAEAMGLLEYKAPELRELNAALAFGDGMGTSDGPAYVASGEESTNVLFADESGEENGVFSLDE